MGSFREEHLEGFVKARLGRVPSEKDKLALSWAVENVKASCTPKRINFLKGAWKEMKKQAGSRTILMPGRDTHLLQLLAGVDRFENFRFRPEISSNVASAYQKGLVKEDFSSYYGVDSGFKGTIFWCLGMEHYHMFSHSCCHRGITETKEYQENGYGRYNAKGDFVKPKKDFLKPEQEKHLLFYGKAGAKASSALSMCGFLEGFPKYWDIGIWNSNKEVVEQDLVKDDQSFVNAAISAKHFLDLLEPEKKRKETQRYLFKLGGEWYENFCSGR